VTTKKIALIAIVLWVGSALVIGFYFVKGRTKQAPDGRTAIILNENERNLVLEEMRSMLASVQGIVRGLSDEKMVDVTQQARASGTAMAAAVPIELMTKLPLEFKQLGLATHQGFDEISVAADQGETSEMVLTRLAEQLTRCVACHQVFRLEAQQSSSP
jgi:hypothetical protein